MLVENEMVAVRHQRLCVSYCFAQRKMQDEEFGTRVSDYR
jgi:hypothetical protein